MGIGAAILGMQATVGLLVAKALTTSAIPYYQGITPGSSPVLALDVFLVQVSFIIKFKLTHRYAFVFTSLVLIFVGLCKYHTVTFSWASMLPGAIALGHLTIFGKCSCPQNCISLMKLFGEKHLKMGLTQSIVDS